MKRQPLASESVPSTTRTYFDLLERKHAGPTGAAAPSTLASPEDPETPGRTLLPWLAAGGALLLPLLFLFLGWPWVPGHPSGPRVADQEPASPWAVLPTLAGRGKTPTIHPKPEVAPRDPAPFIIQSSGIEPWPQDDDPGDALDDAPETASNPPSARLPGSPETEASGPFEEVPGSCFGSGLEEVPGSCSEPTKGGFPCQRAGEMPTLPAPSWLAEQRPPSPIADEVVARRVPNSTAEPQPSPEAMTTETTEELALFRAPASPPTPDVPPTRLVTPMPAYPQEAWVHGIQGDVQLRTWIDEEGIVTAIEVVRGLPYGLTEAAVAAVARWRFRPALRDGHPTATEHALSLRFTL